MLALGGLRENIVSVGCRWNSGSKVDSCISLARFDPIVAKKSLKTSAISATEVIGSRKWRWLQFLKARVSIVR